MPSRIQAITQNDFSGGINAVSSPYLVKQKQVVRCRNMILDEHGALTTRDGYSLLGTGTDVTNPIIYLGVLNKNDGTSTQYAIQQSSTQTKLYNRNFTPWTTVGTFNTNYDIPQSVTINNVGIIAAGYETPRTFDGNNIGFITAGGAQTVPPGAKHIAFHLGSLWVWNTNAQTTSLDGPSSLRASSVNNPNDWPNANQTFISKDDGEVGMGLATFTIAETGISPTQTLVAFKNYSAYQIAGVFGATSFSIQKIKSDMGCVAPRTIQFVSGYGIIRLTHKGFALFNGVDDTLISEEIRPFISGHDEITGINTTSQIKSWAVQSQNPPLYIAACPIGGSTLTRVFVYDLVRKAWTICDYPVAFQSMNLIITQSANPVIQAGTATGGQVLRLFGGDKTDNGAAIGWSFRTKSYTVGSQMRPSYWRRFLMDLAFTPTQAVSFTTNLLGYPTTLLATRSYTGTTPGSQWGSGIWGSFTWADTSLVEDLQDVDIMRTAPAVYISVSGSGFVTVRGIELQARAKPLTRAVY